jgi:ribonuclease VapC
MTVAVLDASALLSMLRSEPGGERVRSIIADSAMTTVNLGEVVGHYARNGVAEADIRLALDPLPVDWIAFDDAMAYAAGLLIPITRRAGLSFGDCACLALGGRLAVPVLTADRSWARISEAAGVEIELISGGLH